MKIQLDNRISIDQIISIALNLFTILSPHSLLCKFISVIILIFFWITTVFFYHKSVKATKGLSKRAYNEKSKLKQPDCDTQRKYASYNSDKHEIIYKQKYTDLQHRYNRYLKKSINVNNSTRKFHKCFKATIIYTLVFLCMHTYHAFSNIDFQETAKYTHENFIKWTNKECELSDVIEIVKKNDSSQDDIKKTNSETDSSSQDNIGGNEKKDLKQDDINSSTSSSIRFIQGNARFYLENINEIKAIDTTSKEFKEIFAAQNGLIQNDITVEDLQMYLQQVIDQKIIEKKEDALASLGTSEDYELINKLSEDELTFFQQCDTAASNYKITGDTSAFRDALPSSSFFESINQQRLNMIQAGKGNYGLSCLVSNWNQTFALEYQNQNGSGDTILYYYIQSIIMDFKCLTYKACSIQEQYIIMKKIEARYSDICACESIKQEYRDRAQLLHSAMTNICNEFYYEHPEYWDVWAVYSDQ